MSIHILKVGSGEGGGGKGTKINMFKIRSCLVLSGVFSYQLIDWSIQQAPESLNEENWPLGSSSLPKDPADRR